MNKKEILEQLETATEGLNFSPNTKYIAFCMASYHAIKRWEESNLPPSLRGSKPTMTIYLIPEMAHGFGERNSMELLAGELTSLLGEGFEVVVMATHSDLVLTEDNFILTEKYKVV